MPTYKVEAVRFRCISESGAHRTGSDEPSFRFRNVMDYPNEQPGGNLGAPIVDATHEVPAVIDSATAELAS